MKQNRRMFFGSVVFHSKHETHDTKYDGHLFLQFLSYESYIQSVAQPFQLAEFFFTPKVWEPLALRQSKALPLQGGFNADSCDSQPKATVKAASHLHGHWQDLSCDFVIFLNAVPQILKRYTSKRQETVGSLWLPKKQWNFFGDSFHVWSGLRS